MRYRIPVMIILGLFLACILPVTGVTTYIGGSPQLSATISGTNEYAPGDEVVIPVVVLNSGTSSMKNDWVGGAVATTTTRPDLSKDSYENNYAVWEGSGTIARDDVPTTAKMVTVGLAPGNAPVTINTDPQVIGDLASGEKATVDIPVKITADAIKGDYQLPLTITYTYLASSEQPAADILQSDYETKSVTLPLTIRIRPEVKIDVTGVVAPNLSVGTGGYVTLTIRNLGFEDGKKATVTLSRNGNSPVIPTDSSVFVGDFPSGGTITCRYKVGISTEAEEQTYPVDVSVTYENQEGDTITSSSDTVGIPVIGKVTFSVIPESASVEQGSQQVLVVRYTNTGDIPVYAAQARLSVVDPLASSDNMAYLGDLAPGDSAVARYSVSADGDAEAKDYALDTEVRYRDSLDNSQVSDSFKVLVQVTPAASGGVSLIVTALVILLIAGGAGYYLLVMRKKK